MVTFLLSVLVSPIRSIFRFLCLRNFEMPCYSYFQAGVLGVDPNSLTKKGFTMALSTFSTVILAAVFLISVLQIALPYITSINDETKKKKESAFRRARSSKKLNKFLSSASHKQPEQQGENGNPRRPIDTKEALDQFSQSKREKVIKSMAKAVPSSQVIEGKPATGQSATVWRKDSRTVSTMDAMNNQEHDDMRQSEPDYHIVFSTSCDLQQHWESYLFFFYAMKVKQPGHIVRAIQSVSYV